MTRQLRGWFTAASVLTFVSVVMGAVVCATQSGASCPTWPGCYPAQFVPLVQLNPVIEFTHRLIAGVTGPTVLVAAVLGRKLADPRPRRLAWIGLAGTLAAGFFGMLVVLVGIPWWLAVLDLASAFTAVVVTLLARLLLTEGAAWVPTPAAAPAWAALGTLATMHLLGLAVAAPNSFTGCLGWPLGVLDADRWPVLQVVRVVLAVAVVVLLAAAIIRSERLPRARLAGRAVGVLVVIELALGGVLLAGGGIGVRTAYAVVAAAIFGATALLAGRAGVSVRAGEISGNDPIPAGLSAE